MRKSLTVMCVFFCCLGIARTICAQAQAKTEQVCSPAMLDVSALPGSPSFTYGVHLFVLEFQNISPSACTLPPIEPTHIFLLPSSNANNQPYYTTLQTGDPGHLTESHPQVLASGAWAHVLFVWTSRVAPEQSCDMYSGIRLGISFQWQLRNEPGIEIRNLWIRACGPLAVTGYRLGKYSSNSPIPQSWIDWYGPNGLRGITEPVSIPSTEIATTSPLLSLSARAKRVMLGDRLFALKLNFPRLVSGGCAFSQLRKRESDGSTVIELQQCDDTAPEKGAGVPTVPRYHDAGVMGLFMSDGNLGFMPEHTGAFEYDVIAPIGWGGGKKPAPHYARARVDLVARDPSLPKQVAVLDPLPACTPAQLRVDSLPPVTSTPLKTVRAYNATNTSEQPCSLAGVPRMRGLDEKGNYQPFLPLACPNCENEFFIPRPNGRIDLNQGEAAHLLVASTGWGTGYCSFTPKLELSFNRDATSLVPSASTGPQPNDIAQSVEVPFGGQDCVSIDISAWRQGSYDGDPLNSHQANLAHASESIPKSAVPAECNMPEFLAHGSPYLIEGAKDPEYAISMERHQFLPGDSVPLYLWTANSTDFPLELGGCLGSASHKAGGYVLYDAYGHRILDKLQIASAEHSETDSSKHIVFHSCNLSVISALPPHTCIVSPVDLAKLYDLPPGEYTISTSGAGDTESRPRRGEKRYETNPATDIHFTVSQP